MLRTSHSAGLPAANRRNQRRDRVAVQAGQGDDDFAGIWCSAGTPPRLCPTHAWMASTSAATAASTPRAQPTATSRPEARTDTTAGDTNPDTTDREPAKATTPDTATTPGRATPTLPKPGDRPPTVFFTRGGARKASPEAPQGARARLASAG